MTEIKYHDEFAEREVLAGLFAVENGFQKALDASLKSKYFFSVHNLKLFEYMRDFYVAHNVVPDKRTILENLNLSECSGMDDISEFSSYLDRLISNKNITLQRLLIKIEELLDMMLIRSCVHLFEESTEKLLRQELKGRQLTANIINELSTLIECMAPTDKMTFLEGFDRVLEAIERRRLKEEKSYYETGFKDLDEAGGIVTGLTYIVGRPGSCKSLLVLILAYNLAVLFDIPVLVMSAELENIDNMERLVAFHSKIDSKKIQRGEISPEEEEHIRESKKVIGNKPVYFAYNANLDIDQIRTSIIWHKEVYNVQVFFIDYFQLLSVGEGHKGDQSMQYSAISEFLRRLSLELKIPIVCAAQAAKRVDDRKDKRIQLQDIRHTDKAAQDAMSVWALYNDSGEHAEEKGILEIKQLKARKGKIDAIIKLRFDGATQSLMEHDFNDDFTERETTQVGIEVVTEDDIEDFMTDADDPDGEE